MSAARRRSGPDSWDLPLFVHILGAMLLVGALTLSAVSLIAAWRSGSAALTKLGLMSLFYGALPGYIVMRGGAQWIVSKEHLDELQVSLDRHRLRRLRHRVPAAGRLAGDRRDRRPQDQPRRGGSPSISARIATGLVSLFLLACLVAVWAMTTKPV